MRGSYPCWAFRTVRAQYGPLLWDADCLSILGGLVWTVAGERFTAGAQVAPE